MPVLSIVKAKTQRKPEEICRLLEHLLQLARTGELTGIAVASICKRGAYCIEVQGEAESNPTFALGAVHMLERRLEMLVLEHSTTTDT